MAANTNRLSAETANQGRAIRAGNRITAENLSNLAQRLGRCGDVDPIAGWVCVTQPHADDVEHMALQIGGPFDGHVYARWGGNLPNNFVIPTQVVNPDA